MVAKEDQTVFIIMILDYFRLTFRSMLHRKLRTGLTIIGILIGIAAIVSLITITQGLENAITEQFDRFGTNRLYVTNKGIGLTFSSLRESLDTDDVELLKGMGEFKWVNEYILETAAVEFANQKNSFSISGFDVNNLKEKWKDIDLNVEKGKLFSGDEKFSVIIGRTVALDAFDNEIRV